MIRICIAGVTGWAGSALVPAIEAAADLELVSAVSRSAAGGAVPMPNSIRESTVPIMSTVREALVTPVDVLVDYTSATTVKRNVLEAIEAKVNVVIGTSGLTSDDFAEIESAALSAGVGVIAAGNFAITAVLMQYFAVLAARYLPTWEVLDYASDTKRDAPSGTARELAYRLGQIRSSELTVPIQTTEGSPEARGLSLDGAQVHSIRIPGIVIGAEVIFGKPGEVLSLRYDGGRGAEPYVNGTLMACRAVRNVTGLKRGLDQVLDLSPAD